jgi:hypothetical protein
VSQTVTATIRLALLLGLALLAGGTAVAPHEHGAGWSHAGLDHPPSALHNVLLEHGAYLADPTGTADASVLAPAPASIALSSVVLALLAARRIRLWRPSRIGLRRILLILAGAQCVIAPLVRPPRASFSS